MPRVGLISDTHGLLRVGARRFLRGCDHIIHGGDIGSQAVLEELAALAPVTAVRGNNDSGAWAEALLKSQLVRVLGIGIYAVHDIADMDIDPAVETVQVVVAGHSHRPSIGRRDGVLYVNPGSCGPRRFKLPVSLGELIVRGSSIEPRIVELSGEELG
jgi:putative phosphoesterase